MREPTNSLSSAARCNKLNEIEESDLNKTLIMNVPLSPEVSAKLDALARDTKCSPAELAGEAIAEFVERDAAERARIRQALEEARSGAPGVSHEHVVQWVQSLDTDHPLPRPKPES